MKMQPRIAPLIAFAVTSLFPCFIRPQGPGPIDAWENLPPEMQAAPYIEATKFAKNIARGIALEGKYLADNPEYAAILSAAGIGIAAALQTLPPIALTTATYLLCSLAIAESAAQIHHAYQNAPENQKSQAVGEEVGKIITDVVLLQTAVKFSSATLAGFRPSQPTSYAVKVDDHAFAAKLNPDGNHYFSIARNLGDNNFKFSVYGLNKENGLRYLGTRSGTQIKNFMPPISLVQEGESASFSSSIKPGPTAEDFGFITGGSTNIKPVPNLDTEQFVKSERDNQAERIIDLINKLGIENVKGKPFEPMYVFDQVVHKIDPDLYPRLEELAKTANNIDSLKKSDSPIWNFLKYSGDPVSTSNIKGASGELNVGVLQKALGRTVVDYNKEFNTKNIPVIDKKGVTYDWVVKDKNDNLILIEVKNQKFGPGNDEGDFIKQITAQLKTIEIFPELRCAKLEVWSEHPLTDVMKNFLNEKGIKYYEGYSTLAKLYYPPVQPPMFFDAPTSTQLRQFSAFNDFFSRDHFLEPFASYEQSMPSSSPKSTLSDSSIPKLGEKLTPLFSDPLLASFAGMPILNEIPGWGGWNNGFGSPWDGYFQRFKEFQSFDSSKPSTQDGTKKTQEKSDNDDDPLGLKKNGGYFGSKPSRTASQIGSTGGDNTPTGTAWSFAQQDGRAGVKAENGDFVLFAGVGAGGGAAVTGSAFISEAMAASLLSIGAIGLGAYILHKVLQPTYQYNVDDFLKLGAETPLQKQLETGVLYTPEFPWQTFLSQEWKPQGWSLDEKPGKKEFQHGKPYDAFKIPVPTKYKPLDAVINLHKITQENRDKFKKDHHKDELADLLYSQYSMIKNRINLPITRAKHIRDIIIPNYQRSIAKDMEDEANPHPEHMTNHIMPAQYQSLYSWMAQGMVALQEYHCLNELITEKTIALKQTLDTQDKFLKGYSEKLDTLTKTDSSPYLQNRKKAIEDSLVKPGEITGVWRQVPVEVKQINEHRTNKIKSTMGTVGLPLQHTLDDELFVFKTKTIHSFNSAQRQNALWQLSNGFIDIVLDTHTLNEQGCIQAAVLQADNIRYLFDSIVEPALLGKNSPPDNKDKRNLCAVSFAFRLMHELPTIENQSDGPFDNFKETLKSALQKCIVEKNSPKSYDYFCNGIIAFCDIATTNDAVKKLLETIQQSMQMGVQAKNLYNADVGFDLLNLLIEKPEQFDDYANRLKEELKNKKPKK